MFETVRLAFRAVAAFLERKAEESKFLKEKTYHEKLNELYQLEYELITKTSDPNTSGADIVLLNSKIRNTRSFIEFLNPQAFHRSSGNGDPKSGDKSDSVRSSGSGDSGILSGESEFIRAKQIEG